VRNFRYKLLKTIKDGHVELRQLLEKHVVRKGLEAIEKAMGSESSKSPDAKAYVSTMLEVHKNYSAMVETAFDNDSTFKAALDKACRQFVNHNSVTKAAKSTAKSPELLAKYCDGLLKKSAKADGGEDVEQLLDGVMVVFKFLEDNDVFQKFYAKALARRLVNQTSSSDDSEASMISKLKQTCGYEWTQKFQRMFQNMGTSKELMVKFHKTEVSKTIGIKDFNVMVLTSGSWPFVGGDSITLPDELAKCCKFFEAFYLNEHQGRKLNWLPHLSKGEIVTCVWFLPGIMTCGKSPPPTRPPPHSPCSFFFFRSFVFFFLSLARPLVPPPRPLSLPRPLVLQGSCGT
jgi:cullin 1